jgi:hypothetical protein
MAIRTKKFEIGKTVVLRATIFVMESHVQGLTAPFRQAALLAWLRLIPSSKSRRFRCERPVWRRPSTSNFSIGI